MRKFLQKRAFFQVDTGLLLSLAEDNYFDGHKNFSLIIETLPVNPSDEHLDTTCKIGQTFINVTEHYDEIQEDEFVLCDELQDFCTEELINLIMQELTGESNPKPARSFKDKYIPFKVYAYKVQEADPASYQFYQIKQAVK